MATRNISLTAEQVAFVESVVVETTATVEVRAVGHRRDIYK